MKKIRVGIDGRLILSQKIGTGIYTTTLVHAIEALAPADIELVVFDDDFSGRFGYRAFARFAHRGLRKIGYLAWLNSYFPVFLKEQRIDIIHSPNIIPPFLKVCKTVITIHDLGLFLHPQFYDARYQQSMVKLIPRACAVADEIIVPSDFVRKELIAVLGVPTDKITVIHEAQQTHFVPITGPQLLGQMRQRFGLPDHFLLTVGLMTARKNLKTLVDAFARACRQPGGRELYLVIVGRDDGEENGLSARATELGIRDRIIFQGYVEDSQLPFFYNLATGFVFPSFYEGFGIPPLEAMACGTPVIAAHRSAIPEIVGDGGMLIDPESSELWAAAMTRIVTQPAVRSELRRRGLVRAAQFSVRRFGDETLDVYRRCING